MTPVISVVIPTHNPRMDYLARVIEALKQQTLPCEQWEIVVVDNGSKQPLRAGIQHAATGAERRWVARQPNGIREEGALAGVGGQESGPPAHRAYGSERDSKGSDSREKAQEEEAGDRGQEGDLVEYAAYSTGQGDLKLTNLKHSAPELELGWHPNARVVREEKLGLTYARLRGFAEAKGELIVMVDDDNVLAPDYLETAVRIAQEHPTLGAFGGKCLPEFEVEPEGWLASVTSGLGLRDRGEVPQLFPEETGGRLKDQETKRLRDEEGESRKVGRWEGGKVKRAVSEFPDCAPIGAGMVLRREAVAAYAERLQARGARQGARGKETITDRKGDSLASGGDNDICLTVLEEGWQVGYLPQLQLTHLIPKGRMTLDYQKRMAREAMRSFILMLDQHGIRPWGAIPKWSVPLRVAKDYLRVQPWRSPERLLRWCMNRGRYEACGRLAAKLP